jgi:murein DD-endopeptidase MepM/ murein hydrolase activator NlpD
VIADLPAPAERTVAPPAGLGGDEVEAPLPQLSPEEAGLPKSAPPEVRPEPPAPISSLSGPARASRVAGLQARALHLARLAESRQESLGGLVDGLRGKSRRLASTPSIWPTEGWVTSGYGQRTSPFTGRRQFHSGIDVASRSGMPVVAPARGRVVFAGKKGPLGRTVILDHGYGVRTTYGHNGKLHVKRGQEVERGEKIAAVGNSGRSTGPHLHYAVQVDGRRVNPMNYILDE